MREAETRQLRAELASVTGRVLRRRQALQRVTVSVAWVWVASVVVIALAFWLDHVSPGSGGLVAALAGVVNLCAGIAAGISRAIDVRAADRHRTTVIESVLEWASRQPGRLGRGVDGLPRFPSEFDFLDGRLYFGAGSLCMFVGAVVPLLPFAGGWVLFGIASILVVSVPLFACGVGLMRLLKRMERRLDRASELIVALSHPHSEVRQQLDDRRFGSPQHRPHRH